jgi:hypothetical protein
MPLLWIFYGLDPGAGPAATVLCGLNEVEGYVESSMIFIDILKDRGEATSLSGQYLTF